MIEILEQPINIILPKTSVRMLIAQPFLEFDTPLQEPFPLLPACAARMTVGIDQVFSIALEFQPHFIVFPEFSVPGVAGVERIIASLSAADFQSPTIVIAGVTGLSVDDYVRLCALPGMNAPEIANRPTSVQPGSWINTSVTFVRSADGLVALWVQPKLAPSWPETNCNHQTMFQGSVIRVFRAQFDDGVPCRFLSMMCFDWVGRQNGQTIQDAFLTGLNTQYKADGSQQNIQWVFVLQHNPQPNHYTFLNATTTFLTQPAVSSFVLRQDAAVIMACTASSGAPARGGSYGFSSVVFGPRVPFDTKMCPPTYATQSQKLRNTATLGTCKDAVFREMGECIHAAEVRVPNFVQPDPTDHTPALLHAKVYPFAAPTVDPRMLGAAVPAVVKWVNDELDNIPDLPGTYFRGAPLEGALRLSQVGMVTGYRHLRSQDLAIRVDGACAGRSARSSTSSTPAVDPAADIDTAWDAAERSGLRHVMQTLTLIAGVSALDIVGSQLHGRYEHSGVEIAD